MGLTTDIKKVIESLVSTFDKETIENNQDIFLKLKELYAIDSNDFLDIIQMAQNDFKILVENVMDLPKSDQNYIVKHIISGLYKHFHTKRIEKLEGFSTSYDKAVYIELMTIKALKKQQNISLFKDYKEAKQIKDQPEKQAYWSPKTVKDTNEAIELFLNWYQLSDIL